MSGRPHKATRDGAHGRSVELREVAMAERPILMSAPMVRAILAGAKTQTRRVVKPQPSDEWSPEVGPYCPTVVGRDGIEEPGEEIFGAADESEGRKCPFGEPGTLLWVRETWRALKRFDSHPPRDISASLVGYEADPARGDLLPVPEGRMGKVRPSIHMPRWASRITLELLSVRVERLQEISEADARAEGLLAQEGDGGGPGWGYKWRGIGYEGARPGCFHTPATDGTCSCKVAGPSPAQCAYRELWDKINGKRAPWASNPWCWVLEFRRVTP